MSASDLALDAWDALEPDWKVPVATWLENQIQGLTRVVEIPEGQVRLPAPEHLFDATTLFFGKNPAFSHVCASRAEAELLRSIADVGLRGRITLPASEAECVDLLSAVEARTEEAKRKFWNLAEQRAGTDKLREQLFDILFRWFTHGRPTASLMPTLGVFWNPSNG